MCATHLVTGTVESATPALETLLAHLAIESHGLNQSGLFKLFCRAASDHFEASGVCCSLFSRQTGWIVGETLGCHPQGKHWEALAMGLADWLGTAKFTGEANFHQSKGTEVLCRQQDSA